MKLTKSEYIVKYHSERDYGYGIEASSDEVVIYVENGEIDEVVAYGLHYITEYEVDWDPGLEDDECLELILAQHGGAL